MKKVTFDTEPSNAISSLWRKLEAQRGHWGKSSFSDVHTYLMFVGYPRSGHTLVGSLLDAHPNSLVSHELDALYYVKEEYGKWPLFYLIQKNARKFEKQGKKWEGYNYQVEAIGNGKLTHIGDKCGGRSTRRLGLDGQQDLLERLSHQVDLPIKLIHVVRNPFDNISTMAMRIKENTQRYLHNTLKNALKRYKTNLATNQRIRQSGKWEFIDIYLDDLVDDPKGQMSRLGEFLGLEMTESYLEVCKQKVWPEVSKSRDKIKEYWTESLQSDVKKLIDQYDFLGPFKGTGV